MTTTTKKVLTGIIALACSFVFVSLLPADPTDNTTVIPVIRLGGNSVDTVIAGSGYNDLGAEVVIDGVCIPATTSGKVNTTVPGLYLIDYDFRDSSGRTAATITRTVHVLKKELPVLKTKE